ncbi:MAG TPA: low molecular weight phosphatase family protein [Candidatus Acidoferrum sp.]
MKTQRAKVLFICIGNSCRSPMAEAIARKDSLELMDASSAGLSPLGFVADMTTQTLLKNGYAVDGLTSKAISSEAWESADIVINMSGRAREFAFRNFNGHAKVEDWEIEDPYGDAAKYQGTYESVQRRVAELARRLRKKSVTPGDSKHDASSKVTS